MKARQFQFDTIYQVKQQLYALHASGFISPLRFLQILSQLVLDYLEVLQFVHASPVGSLRLCLGNPQHLLSQFAVTEDLRLVLLSVGNLQYANTSSSFSACFNKFGVNDLSSEFVKSVNERSVLV